MSTNTELQKHTNKINESQAQVLVPTINVAKDLEFFKTWFGFKLLNIFPDDDPEVAVLVGHGMQIRLEKNITKDNLQDRNDDDTQKCTLRCTILLLTDDVKMLQLKDDKILSPGGGAVVKVQTKSYKIPDIEKIKHGIKQWKEEVYHTPEEQIMDTSSWVVGRAGMLYRDLLTSRLGGLMTAEHICIPKGGLVPDNVHFHTIRFQLIFCYHGWVKLVYEDQGDPFVLYAGDCVTQPPEIRHRVLECSDNMQVIEIGVPSTHMTTLDHDMELPTKVYNPKREWNGQKFCHFKSAAVGWEEDNGIFQSKDTGVYDKTNGLVSVKVLRISESYRDVKNLKIDKVKSGNIVFHFVMEGRTKLNIVGKEPYLINKGDSYAISNKLSYQLKETSSNLQLLQVGLTGSEFDLDKD